MSGERKTIHASCVEINGRGILICGGSGAGKTSLLVELLGRGGKFVADDGVLISRKADSLRAQPTVGNKGLIGTSPFEVADFAETFPAADTVPATSVALCIQLETDASEDSEGILADVPRLYLERDELTSMADVCESAVKRLISLI
ncbi:MAG TPA: hypothetical protein PLR83_03535 [Pyrinomonadaceae bacterium]|nr:hypothetical protein [Pyrinomonadaceae bacterium]